MSFCPGARARMPCRGSWTMAEFEDALVRHPAWKSDPDPSRSSAFPGKLAFELRGQAAHQDPQEHGAHSMRRTKATLIYRRTRNLRAVQLLLSHTKLDSKVRYVGIEVDDALEMAERTEV